MNKDTSYCTGLDCPLRESCQRYVKGEKDSGYEVAWWTDGLYNEETNDCDLKIDNQ